MNMSMLALMIMEGSRLVLGQSVAKSPDSKSELLKIVQDNEKRSAFYKNIFLEYENEYFGLKSNRKKITKIYQKNGKSRVETTCFDGCVYQRVAANGFVYTYEKPRINDPEHTDADARVEIVRVVPLMSTDTDIADSFKALFLNGPIPWNRGLTLDQAVLAVDTEVEFSMKKPKDGKPIPVIKLKNKKDSNMLIKNNILGKKEYRLTGNSKIDDKFDEYDLEIWFSPDHNFSISKLIYTTSGTDEIIAMDVVDNFREIKNGFFLPQTCSFFTLYEKKKTLVLCNKVKLVNASIDEAIPEKVFTFQIPEGVRVVDRSIGMVWYANKEGKFDHYLKNENGIPRQTWRIVGTPEIDPFVLFIKDPLCFLYPAKKH